MCMKRHNIMPWVLKRKKPIKTCRFCADAGFYYILSRCLGEVIEQGQDTDYKLKAFPNSINYPDIHPLGKRWNARQEYGTQNIL